MIFTALRRALEHLPLTKTLVDYGRVDLGADAKAGLTSAVLLIPQSMAYAQLAGLPPLYGLYAALVPSLVYALLGSSRVLSVGPVAMDSLLVASVLATTAQLGSPAYLLLAPALSLLVGSLQLAFGFLRLGFLGNFLSHPVILGFTAGTALLIGLGQLEHFLAIPLGDGSNLLGLLDGLRLHWRQAQVVPLLLGLVSALFLVSFKLRRSRFPAALALLAVSSALVYGLGLGESVVTVGRVPGGLPAFRLPTLEVGQLRSLLPSAIPLALIAFLEAISVGRSYAVKAGLDIAPNREFVALGTANLLGSFFQAYPVTGSFSRTAVNAEAGARTQVAGLVATALVALTLLFLTPLFFYLPKVALAATILVSLSGLIDLRRAKRLWHAGRTDLAFYLVTFFGVLSLGVMKGLTLGVLASLGWFLFSSTRPHLAVLGRLPGSRIYRNVKRFPQAVSPPGLLVVRMDAPLYFGNVAFLKDSLKKLEAGLREPLRAVILDAAAMSALDTSANEALRELDASYNKRGVRLYLAAAHGPVRDLLQRNGPARVMGPAAAFSDVHEAVIFASEGATSADSSGSPAEPSVNEAADRESQGSRYAI